MKQENRRGFTLIELSIVLVVIGLIVGGVLVGQSLVSAAAVRAQIAQIEKFQTAANTFREKYGYLPGDIKDPDASGFGFASRGQYAGEGDGNGVIEGVSANTAGSNGPYQAAGETAMFWADLAKAGMIAGSYPYASASNVGGGGFIPYPTSSIFPVAQIGNSGYVTVYSVSGSNYLAVSGISAVAWNATYGTSAMTVAQASSIDSKIDDGLPESGKVIAAFLGQFGPGWDLDLGAEALYSSSTLAPMNTGYTYPASATSCQDNGSGGAPPHYSLSKNNGAGVNCGLSFRM